MKTTNSPQGVPYSPRRLLLFSILRLRRCGVSVWSIDVCVHLCVCVCMRVCIWVFVLHACICACVAAIRAKSVWTTIVRRKLVFSSEKMDAKYVKL